MACYTFGFADAALKVGSPAPSLTIAKWVKGNPVHSFESGKVYVVEFWATWCGPCKASIPRLTELAKKYDNKITVIGVDVWVKEEPTDDSYFPAVERFVKTMGEKMVYNVGLDSRTGTMAKNWLEAAGKSGIPVAFV